MASPACMARNLKRPSTPVNARGSQKTHFVSQDRTLTVLAGHPEHVARAVAVGGAAGDKQEIRQTIHIANRGLADRLVGLGGEFHYHAFRPATYGARQM